MRDGLKLLGVTCQQDGHALCDKRPYGVVFEGDQPFLERGARCIEAALSERESIGERENVIGTAEDVFDVRPPILGVFETCLQDFGALNDGFVREEMVVNGEFCLRELVTVASERRDFLEQCIASIA